MKRDLTEDEILGDPALLLEACLQMAWDRVAVLKRVVRWHNQDKWDRAYAKECQARVTKIIVAIKALEAREEPTEWVTLPTD